MADTFDLQSSPALPAYFIYRDAKPGEPIDALTPLCFFPPKDSDDLFDALRAAFPQVKSHSERMRDAMIQYLMEERMAEQAGEPTWTADVTPSTWPSTTSGSISTLSSPDLFAMNTPASSACSPDTQSHPSGQDSLIASANGTPPPLNQMTSVFSLTAAVQPKQRFRRKMTAAEKVEYRKRRLAKACDHCSKRKRKCHHGQADAHDHITRRKASENRVVRSAPKTAVNTVNAPKVAQQLSHGVLSTPMSGLESVDPSFLDDFSLFTTPVEDVVDDWWQFDHLSGPSSLSSSVLYEMNAQQDWFQDPLRDFTLLDHPVSDHHNTGQPSTMTQNLTPDQSFDSVSSFDDVLGPTSSLLLGSPGEAQTYDHRDLLDPSAMVQQHNTGAFRHSISRQAAREHAFGTREMHGIEEAVVNGQQALGLASNVMRLLSTAKALRRFSGLLRDRAISSSPPVPLANVVAILRHNPQGVPAHTVSSAVTHHKSPQHARKPPTSATEEREVVHSSSSSSRRSKQRILTTSSRQYDTHTLGEGFARDDGVSSSELYMLRRRITEPSHRGFRRSTLRSTLGGFPLLTTANESAVLLNKPNSPANGGAYLRQENVDSHGTRTVTHGERQGTSSLPSTPVLSHSDATLHEHGGAQPASPWASLGVTHKTRVRTTAASGLVAFAEDRLMDHVRYRDHHGRPQPQTDRLRDYHKVKDHRGRRDSLSAGAPSRRLLLLLLVTGLVRGVLVSALWFAAALLASCAALVPVVLAVATALSCTAMQASSSSTWDRASRIARSRMPLSSVYGLCLEARAGKFGVLV